MVKTTVESYWTEELRNEAEQRSTLNYCTKAILQVGRTHPVWSTVESNTTDVKKGICKARLLTGTYLLQTNKAKFNKYEVEDTCPLCRLEPEDREHMITRCPAFSSFREKYILAIRNIITDQVDNRAWE